MSEINAMSQEQWVAEARRRYGDDHKAWRFRCISCGHEQSIADAVQRNPKIDAAEAQNWIYFACEGRHTAGQGCDWSLGGLFQFHERVVDGTPVFLFADETPTRKPFGGLKGVA